MSFWESERLKTFSVITKEEIYSSDQFLNDVKKIEEKIGNEKKAIILILCDNDYKSIAVYCAALRTNNSVMLINTDLENSLIDNIIRNYKPKWIYSKVHFNDYYEVDKYLWCNSKPTNYEINKELAVLLSTSGTTGSRKFVRLSYKNIQANADSIAKYLKLDYKERAVMNLPMSYSYGMSIINSHLLVGGTIILTNESVMSKSFWQFIKDNKATSLPGVPYTYQILHRIGFTKMNLPDLKTLTQAGGRLNERLTQSFASYAKENGKNFYVMYGQTEASPRISYIPPDRLLDKIGSIGITIPGGELSISNETGELIYKGDNVMMGYSESIEDLAKGDECNGVLNTGDLAEIDEDGYFSIIGRLKRFIKLYGLRINLDDVEKKLEELHQIPLACTGNDEKLVVVIESNEYVEKLQISIEKLFNLHRSSFLVLVVESIPRFSNGKTDYLTLKEKVL